MNEKELKIKMIDELMKKLQNMKNNSMSEHSSKHFEKK